ncbi:MAG: CPBP family intramembrane glutamic endopeptidase [Pseudomonadota bacterium]
MVEETGLLKVQDSIRFTMRSISPPEELGNVGLFWMVLILTLPFILTFYAVGEIWPDWLESDPQPLPEMAFSLVSFLLILAFLAVVLKSNLISWRQVLGSHLEKPELLHCSLLGIPMVGLAIVCIYVLYLPLSHIWPGFVASWLLEPEPPIIWLRSDLDGVLGSAGNLVAACLLAPIAEEVLFRSLMLNRLRRLWGTTAAIVLSSLVFAALHVDHLGAFLFGVILSVYFLRSGSLVGPIVVHASNNVVASVLEAVSNWWYHPAQTFTIAEFQATWWFGIIGTMICVPWLVVFWRAYIAR